jgi:hypothetical protein
MVELTTAFHDDMTVYKHRLGVAKQSQQLLSHQQATDHQHAHTARKHSMMMLPELSRWAATQTLHTACCSCSLINDDHYAVLKRGIDHLHMVAAVMMSRHTGVQQLKHSDVNYDS